MMSDNKPETEPTDSDEIGETGFNSIYSDDGALLETVVESVEESIANSDGDALRATLRDLHESEVGDILEAIGDDNRARLVELAGEDFDFAALLVFINVVIYHTKYHTRKK